MSYIRRGKTLLRSLGTGPALTLRRRHSVLSGPFRPSGSRRGRIALVLGGGVTITAYFAVSEIVPYSGRRHVVFPSMSPLLDILLDIVHIEEEFDGSMLSADDPISVHVRRIGNEIIHALECDALRETELHSDHGSILGWIRKKLRPSTKHLEGLKWEVLVAHLDRNAFCLPGGRIIISTGCLKDLKTDAEIATVLCHEVAHAVARHHEERAIRFFFLLPLMMIISWLLGDNEIAEHAISTMLKCTILPFIRRNELEADYIGLMLLATAGYNPCVAPTLWEKMGRMFEELDKFGSTHPSFKKRARKLVQSKVMEKALCIYRQAPVRHEVDVDASTLARHEIDNDVSLAFPS